MGEDVELCLEIQVDPASKRILSNPERCRSALLDVTVVKPKELEAFGTQRTNTLRADEVRKLITSMEKQRRQKQKVLDKLKYDDTIVKVRKHDEFDDIYRRPKKPYPKQKERISSLSPVDDLERKDFIGITESVEPLFCEIRRSLKNVETRITNMQDINLMISHTTIDASASEEFVIPKHKKHQSRYNSFNHLKNPTVYRVEAPHRDLRSVLVCKNKNKYYEQGDRIEGKCLCENCGIVGLLMECQKHPLLPELTESPSPAPSDYSRHISQRNKKARFNVSKNVEGKKHKNLEDVAYINQLTKRVKLLEHRLAEQEDRVVPKDYFRKIMSKMLSNFSPKSKSKSEISVPRSARDRGKSMKLDEKIIETSKLLDKTFCCRSSEALKCFRANLNYASPSPREPTKTVTQKEKGCTFIKNDKSTITDDDFYDGRNIWRWGEEILKPGIDLKNRIVTLLNDILSKFALTENVSTHTSVKANVADTTKHDDYSSETIKKFMKHMSVNVPHPQNEPKTKYTREVHDPTYNLKREKDSYERYQKPVKEDYKRETEKSKTITFHTNYQQEEKNKSHHTNYQSKKQGKNVDVSYVNPKLNQWRKDSRNDLQYAPKPFEQKPKADGKQEFLKIVSKAKQYQKNVLWRNIWDQAKANGQNKEDKITIKIPISKKDNKGNELFETELTIGEVEAILKGFSWP